MCRGFLQRKQTAKMRAEELVFLGMVPPPKSKSQKNMPVHVAKKVEVSLSIKFLMSLYFIVRTSGGSLKNIMKRNIWKCAA